MQRSFIVFGDFHLTDNRPICRKEKDFIATQRGKLAQIIKIAKDTKSTLLCAGDFYDYWNHDGYGLVNLVNSELGDTLMYGVAGNHELPHHSMEQYNRTPLQATTNFRLLTSTQSEHNVVGFSFGIPATQINADICVQHRMIFLSDPIHGFSADKYDVHHEYDSVEYKDYCVVVTGDNHRSFVYQKDDNHVWVNCGSVYRTSVTEKEYTPSCWQIILHDDSVEVIRHILDVVVDDVDRTEMYLDRVKNSFVSKFAEEIRKQVSGKRDFLAVVHELCVDQDDEVIQAVNMNIEEAQVELK